MKEPKKKSVDFSIKASWLAISKMYNSLGAEYDITHSIGFVLLNIDREKGSPATKIAPLMGMEARSLTRMLKSIEEKGYIERVPDATDKRKVIIKLTEIGQKKRELARVSVKSFHNRVKDIVSQEKLDMFYEVIDQITHVAENFNREDLETEAAKIDGVSALIKS